MYLKRLDILGFKSFAQKTTIQFSNGVTAIVGPNGCGKTNVLDALRWVLGEQRVSLLRGGKMEEVIFNGSQGLKPLGMSEVTLSVLNNRGILPTEYSEVQVTRRLFRSGESEYLLNKVPCRLRDIAELFADTGMGAHSYSVIQQDMVEAILSDKAEERRFLFEEAAGITKYKQRKKAALRKLEATEQDFLRLKDIHAEVRTQVNSLYRQHKKAERYQRVLDDIKAWELFLSSRSVKSLERERRTIQAELESGSDRRSGFDTQVTQAGAELESTRKEQVDNEHTIGEVGNEIFEVTEQVHASEREISVAREKRSNAESLIRKNETEIESIKRKHGELSEQREGLESDLSEARRMVTAAAETLESAEKELTEADRRLMESRQVKERENQRLLELEGRLSSGKTEETGLREQEDDLAAQLGLVDSKITDNSPLQSNLISELNTLKGKLEELTDRRQTRLQRRTEINAELESSQERSEELAEELAGLSASVEACEARKNLLTEMMINFEGHGAGVVAAMEHRDRWPGIVGTVGELFVPVEGMETAVERALGDLAECIVCRDRNTANDVIAWLEQESKGRAGLLIPDPPTLNPAVKRPELNQPGFVGWLDERVSVPSELKSLKQAVLARVAVFEPDVNPDEVLPHLPFGFAVVTTDGVVYQGNLMVGGSADSFPIFRRKERIQQQESLIEELTQKQERLRAQRNQLSARQAELRAESARLAGELEELNEEIERQQQKLGEFDYERRTLITEFERLEKERGQLKARLESIRSRQTSLGLDYGQLSDLKNEVVGSLQTVGQKLEEYEQAAGRASDAVSKSQVALIEARNRVDQLEGRIGHTDDIVAELTRTQALRADETQQARADIATCTTTIEEHERRLRGLFGQREELNEQQSRLREVQSEILERVTEAEKRIKEARDLRESLNDEIHKLEMRSNTISGEISAVRSRLLEEYETDVVALDMERPDEKLDDSAAQEHLRNQKEKLKKFGAVNLLALEEYGTASEREKFLREQLDDLEAAKRDLQATISKINITARRMFLDTFEKARENFQTLFVELFSGGDADISLSEPEDPLESPIEITARPRGKKLLSIAQMSGGERALTAISLLFSLYLVKPSPFCILDEIDAPLDDANCHRFLKMIRHFAGQTQFVIITHNKITMEAADNLYGITMEMPGVSRLVAVRFNEAGDVIDQVPDAGDEVTEPEIPQAVRERITPSLKVPVDEEAGQ